MEENSEGILVTKATGKAAQVAKDVAAAREASSHMKPSMRWERLRKSDYKHPDPNAECWENSIYFVTLRKHRDGWPLGGGKWALLGISSHDGAARHDWRDFQNIKNDLVGPNWEAVELYPDEERLLDPSNFYMLWCAPAINVGVFQGRSIMNEKSCIAPQRPFGK